MGIKILLADDSVTAQNMGKKILAEAGHDVVTVSNGAAAAKKIAEASPDLVLLDVFMPGYTGLELCEKLRNATATAKLPVLLTVGRMEPYSPQDGARVKADGVIVKPFEASDLIAAVDRLAQKLKGGQPLSHEGDSTARIPPPTQKEIPPVQKEKEYERTQLMDAGQIAAMLKQAAPTPAAPVQAAAAAPAPVQEFHVAPPAHSEEARPVETATPAFSEELPSQAREVKTGPVPSYLAQYLVEHAPPRTEGLPPEPPATAEIPKYSNLEEEIAFAPTLPKESKKPSWARNAAEAGESSFRTRFSGEAMLEHFREHAVPEPPVASAEGLELTAAAPVPDIPVPPAPGLELTSQAVDAPTFVMRDPALATGHDATMEFTTKFGTDAPDAELPEVSAPTSAPADEFEARLNAAMSSYEQSPVAEAALPQAEASAEPIQAAPTDSAESFLARVEAAMHVTESADDALPEITLADNLISPTETATDLAPLPLPTAPEHLASEAELPSLHPIETSHFSAGPELIIDEAQSVPELQPPFSQAASGSAIAETLHTEAVSHSAVTRSDLEHEAFHEPDEAVIRQMRQAMATFHPESTHGAEENVEPMAMAAAAAATTPVPLRHEPELEVARGTADVIEIKPPASSMLVSEPEERSAPAADANRLAAVVERVMKRELPGLIWKIMAELDLKKRD